VKVTNALLPHFRKQRFGKIITVSSIVALIGPPNLSFYTASKHAVEGYFKSLRFELNPFNIKVSMVEPAWFKTNLGSNAIKATAGTIPEYNSYRTKANAATQKGLDEAEKPDAVVKKISDLISAKDPKFSNPVGGDDRDDPFPPKLRAENVRGIDPQERGQRGLKAKVHFQRAA
jgi:NAD(P)-dependent dehydrogenase (short-subunit alcohol dehydrogenase family)